MEGKLLGLCTALHQAPQVEKKGAKERQRGPVVENDSDEEAW